MHGSHSVKFRTKLHTTDGCQNILQLALSEGNLREEMLVGSKLQAAIEYKGFCTIVTLKKSY